MREALRGKERQRQPHWYERECWPYDDDLNLIRKYAIWLSAGKWQLFATFTFGRRVIDAEADQIFTVFHNALERTLGADVPYVRGDEKRFSGCGKPASGRHFHAVLACAYPIPQMLIEMLWSGVAGGRGDGAEVEPFDPSRSGLSYVLKMMNQHHGDWRAEKLYLILPLNDLGLLNHQQRRNLKRHQSRQQAASAAMQFYASAL
jgi:hypothetical protein